MNTKVILPGAYEDIIYNVCHCKYIDKLGYAQIGRYFNLTYKEVSDIIRKTTIFRAWIERNGITAPIYYEVDGKEIVRHFLGRNVNLFIEKNLNKSLTP